MGLLRGTRRTLLGAKLPYYRKVLSYNPIAYWPLWEPSGVVARCLVNPAQNGAYVGVTLGQPGIGDGSTCPLFDGVNDIVAVTTAALQAAFDGGAGSAMIWARVFNAGVWTDATFRTACTFGVDANNRVTVAYRHGGANNRITQLYNAGGGSDFTHREGLSTLDWMHFCVTWDQPVANQAIFYYDGANPIVGPGLLAWVGALSANWIGIGAWNEAVINDPWYGWLAHCAVWDTVLAPTQILDLAAV